MINIIKLLQQLKSGDRDSSAKAKRLLSNNDSRVISELVDILNSGPKDLRVISAKLLGRHKKSNAAVEALLRAVREPDSPKLRKNSAIALGRLKIRSAAPVLIEMISREENDWVRESMILALGAIGGAEAEAFIRDYSPSSEAEAGSVHKARGKLLGAPAASWRPDIAVPGIHLEAPVGLEAVAVDEAHSVGMKEIRRIKPGLIALAEAANPSNIMAPLRCSYGLRIILGDVKTEKAIGQDDLRRTVESLFHIAPGVSSWPEWIDTGGGPLSFRLSLEGLKLPRRDFREILSLVQKLGKSFNMVDNPSGYVAEAILSFEAGRTRLFLKPTFVVDRRFDYRLRDVGAAINPIVAACLARLVGPARGGQFFDPTCGSGTLLVERGLYDPAARLRGIDISPTSVKAARSNTKAAGMKERCSIECADAALDESWGPCDVVMANLPFGIRVGHQNGEISTLYDRIVRCIANNLTEEGVGLLYSANRRSLDAALSKANKKLKVTDKYLCTSGGLSVHIRCLNRSEGTRFFSTRPPRGKKREKR